MDHLLGAGVLGGGVHVAGKTDQTSGQADQTVHERHQLGHLRHLDGFGRIQTNAATHNQSRDDPRDAVGRHTRAEDGGEHRQRHANNAVEVAAT